MRWSVTVQITPDIDSNNVSGPQAYGLGLTQTDRLDKRGSRMICYIVPSDSRDKSKVGTAKHKPH